MSNTKIQCDECKFCDICIDYGWENCQKYTPAPKTEQTNEEWIHSLTTEQLAEWIADKSNEIIGWIISEVDEHDGYIDEDNYWQKKSDVLEWLKEKHH